MPKHFRRLNSALTTRRGLQCLTAAAVAVVALIPFVAPPLARGRAWQRAFPYTESDELAYAAYVRALADGRPRLSDPYTGADGARAAAQTETLYSIQFMPAYALAAITRATGLPVSAVFALLGGAAATAAALVLFWLIAAVTGDARLAAAGTLIVLCLAAWPTRYGPLHYVWHYLNGRSRFLFLYLPFMRRYVPAAAFPLYLAFGALIWRALASTRRRAALTAAACAGALFVVLVYTYFFLWTAAAAWFAAVVLVWLAARPARWRADLKVFGVITALAALGLGPYSFLLARRALTTDATQYLWRTHAPAPFHLPEVLAAAVLLLLAWAARRKLVHLGDRACLFTVACALVPFFVFNQQVLTGRTLQPIHYEMYAANFNALLAAVLACGLLRRARPAALFTPQTYVRALLACALLTFTYGVLGAARTAQRMNSFFVAQDETNPVALRLAAIGRAGGRADTQSVVFAPDMTVANTLPTVAPQPVLWSLNMFLFEAEGEREKYAQFLYYTGVSYDGISERDVDALDPRRRLFLIMLLGHTRLNLNIRPDWQPIQPAEYAAALRAYTDYAHAFSRERAAHPLISYLVVAADDRTDLANFDRWYERDAGERIGNFVLYRVRLRP